jgi:hypothetical protein
MLFQRKCAVLGSALLLQQQPAAAHLISPSQVEPLVCTWNTFSPKRATGLVGGGPLGLKYDVLRPSSSTDASVSLLSADTTAAGESDRIGAQVVNLYVLHARGCCQTSCSVNAIAAASVSPLGEL